MRPQNENHLVKHKNLSKNSHFRQKFALPHFGNSINRIPSTQLIIHGHVLWNPLFQVHNQIVSFAMAQLSCSFTSLCGNECDISWPGREQLVPLISCVDSIKEHLRDVKVSQTSVASEKELILARVQLVYLMLLMAAISRYARNMEWNLEWDSDLQKSASIPFMEIRGERLRDE